MTPCVLRLATLFIRGPRTTSWSCYCWSRDRKRCCRHRSSGSWGGWCGGATGKNCNLSAVPELFRFSSTNRSSRIQRIRAFNAIAPLCIVIRVIFVSWWPAVVRSNVSPLHHDFISGHSHWQLEFHSKINMSTSKMSTGWIIWVLWCSIRYILNEFEGMRLKAFLRTGTTVGTNHNILVAPVRSVQIALDFNYITLSIRCLTVPCHGIANTVKPSIVALCSTNTTHFVCSLGIQAVVAVIFRWHAFRARKPIIHSVFIRQPVARSRTIHVPMSRNSFR
mmetsp:Transcript_48685/g.58934  ORF Transcript_48685/g.58934 Transcript_48685/m.58934 type:complete len:278 (+) Transcript_48685:794-1627(+)